MVRAPPRPHRDAVALGPFDEVGDDQEIAGEPHLGDDRHLPVQAFPVVLLGRGGRDLLQPRLQPLARLVGQFLGLGPPRPGVEARQDGRAGLHHEGAAPRDLQRRVTRLGQVGEQAAHLLGRFEPVLVRHPAPVVLTDEGAVGDAHQGVVGAVLALLGVMNVVGGDQRRVGIIGPLHQARLGGALGGRVVALQLDIEAVAEHPAHLGQRLAPLPRLAAGEQAIDRPVWPAGQQDQPRRMFLDQRPRDLGLGRLAGDHPGVQIGRRRQSRQVQPPLFVLDQQRHGRTPPPALARPPANPRHR